MRQHSTSGFGMRGGIKRQSGLEIHGHKSHLIKDYLRRTDHLVFVNQDCGNFESIPTRSKIRICHGRGSQFR